MIINDVADSDVNQSDHKTNFPQKVEDYTKGVFVLQKMFLRPFSTFVITKP